jgi:hypothetical protein
MKSHKSYSEKIRGFINYHFFLLFFVGVTSFLSVMYKQSMRLFQASGLSRKFGLKLGVRLRYKISFRIHQILQTLRARQT